MTTPDKAALRQQMLAARRTMASNTPDAGAMLAQHLGQLPLPAPGVVAGYTALGVEIEPAPLLAALRAIGWQVALPHTSHAHYNFRIGNIDVHPDVILAPLVAVDAVGHRLGRGGGWYDRAIAAARRIKPVTVIGLAYAGQRVAALPAEAHDIPLDGLLTERGYHSF